MRNIQLYLLCVLFIGCYNDDETQTVQSENSTHRFSDITKLIKEISVHNGTFDNIIDNTSCFSLVFPYQIKVNSEIRTISSKLDIAELSNEDETEIIYPVNSVFYNYEEHQINSSTDFNLIDSICKQNFDLQFYSCLEFQYPITFKEFNDLTRSFETFHLSSDKEVYLHLENLHDNDIFEIEYPIFLLDPNSNSIRVDSNADFEAAFNNSIQDCQ